MSTTWIDVAGYHLPLDRRYHRETHLWVLEHGDRLRIGLDPLGVETSGTLAQLAFAPPGTEVRAGEPLGSMEAEKFVGPLLAPVAGVIVVVNAAAVADPGLVHRDCFGDGWLAELAPAAGTDLAACAELAGGDDIAPWFAARVADYRLKGVLAE